MALDPIHPGDHLAEALDETGLSAAELARQLDIPTNRITGIVNGQRAITADTALRLGHWFGTSAEFWLNLQVLYELRLAERERGHEIDKLPSAGYRLTYVLKSGTRHKVENLWPMQRAIERGRQLIKNQGMSAVSQIKLEGPDKTIWEDAEVRELIRQHA